MIATPHIAASPLTLTAAIHLVVPRDQIRTVMGPGLTEVRALLAAQRVEPAGPWLTHHFRMPGDTFDYEICVPVAQPIEPGGRVYNGRLEPATVARTVLRGGYEQLGEAWAELGAWIVAQRHTPRGELVECYVVGPESSDDPADWRTRLDRPLAT